MSWNGSCLALLVHVLAGCVALLFAPAAMVVRKGARWHRAWGKVYLGAMAMIATSALILSLANGNFVFIVLTTSSWYLAYSGARALARKTAHARASALDWAMSIGVLLVNVALVVYGAALAASRHVPGLENLAFAPVGIAYAAIDVRHYLGAPQPRGQWIQTHVARFVLSYVACVIAFAATNLHVTPLVTTLVPLAGGIATIAYWRRRVVAHAQ